MKNPKVTLHYLKTIETSNTNKKLIKMINSNTNIDNFKTKTNKELTTLAHAAKIQ